MCGRGQTASKGKKMKGGNYKKELDRIKESIKNAKDIQCSDGNWDYNPYMMGIANGLIFADAVINGDEPKFLNPPEEFLQKKEDLQKIPS